MLRSVRAHLPGLTVSVLYAASDTAYRDGYTLCETQHPRVIFVPERDFRSQVLELLASGGSNEAMFLCDDDVVFRSVSLETVTHALEGSPDMLCFSLRLGRNTTNCYSLRRPQELPRHALALGDARERMLYWDWADADADWSYPGSTDATVFRRHQLLRLIALRTNWSGPNELEDALNQACQTALLPLMGSFMSSAVTGCPVNIVNATHRTNRNGERFHHEPRILNDRYLAGARLLLDPAWGPLVDGAHTELPLSWAA